jgi:hypothetical protein
MHDDINLKLLAGLPLEIDNICSVYPLKLKDISSIGYSKYNLYLMNLIAEPKDFDRSEEVV